MNDTAYQIDLENSNIRRDVKKIPLVHLAKLHETAEKRSAEKDVNDLNVRGLEKKFSPLILNRTKMFVKTLGCKLEN